MELKLTPTGDDETIDLPIFLAETNLSLEEIGAIFVWNAFHHIGDPEKIPTMKNGSIVEPSRKIREAGIVRHSFDAENNRLSITFDLDKASEIPE